ncbi:MAG: lysophospholipid acyltransferase family protein [Planctomycetaceae bacterium]
MKIRSRLLTQLAARFAVFVLRTLFRTLRLEVYAPFDIEIYTSAERPETHISSVWHDQLLFSTFCVRSVNMSALISRHQDGEYLAESMRILGFGTVRGSSNRGAVAALKEMVSAGTGGTRLVMTPDGPRGPHHELKNGIIYIASRTGMPIICVASVCKSKWLVKGSWTNMVIPKPFTRTIMVASEMITIPPDLEKEEIEAYRQQIQQRMNEVEIEANAILAGERSLPSHMQQDHAAEDENRQQAA